MINTYKNSAKSKLANLLGIPASTITATDVTTHGGFADIRLLAGKRDWNGNGGIAITCRIFKNGGWAGHETWHDNLAEVSANDVALRYRACA